MPRLGKNLILQSGALSKIERSLRARIAYLARLPRLYGIALGKRKIEIDEIDPLDEYAEFILKEGHVPKTKKLV